jgi:TolB-like protein/DNA-binding winged helix-turn-helix (wHTH) protein/Tfp pilus assembly protein PilF
VKNAEASLNTFFAIEIKRIRAHLMQDTDSQKPPAAVRPELLRVDDLLIDRKRHSVRRGSELLELTDRSFRLLAALITHAPERVDKDQLIAEVWDDAVVSDDTLAQRVSLLRKSLGDDSQKPRYIAAVRGRGYRLIPQPQKVATAPAKRRSVATWAAVAALTIIGVYLLWQPASDPDPADSVRLASSLAVLPFADMSANQDHQFFADGMQEQLLSRLAQIDELAIISRTSVEPFRDSDLGLTVIADQLGADAIIEGSVRVDDDRLRVTVQLIDGASDEHIWAANFDRQLSVQDVFAVQDEVANQIAEALRLNYVEEVDDGVVLPTQNLEAYNLYLLGRYHTFRQTTEDLENAVNTLEQAIAIDPEFAEAYATLGWAYSFLGAGYGSRLPDDVYPKSKEAALRAMALDANLADARTLYADILTWYDWDFVAAEREYLKTLEIDPLNNLGYALFLSTQERHEEAIEQIERSLAAAPNDPYVRINAGWRYLNAEDFDKAIAAAIAAPNHIDSKSLLGLSRLAQGDTGEAIDVFEAAVESDGRTARNVAHLAAAYYQDGRRADADLLLDELEDYARGNYLSPDLLALVYFSAGDADHGFALLNQAFEERSRGMIFLQVNEMLRDYRDDPRYLKLVEQVGL